MSEAFDLVLPDAASDSARAQARANAQRILQAGTPTQDAVPELSDLARSAARYCVDDELANAINMALCVRAPLLVTGEPGTGKTQVAYYLSWYLDVPLMRYQARSTSTANDLKYDFDAVAYLRYAQSGEGKERAQSDFLRKRALWLAYESDVAPVLLIDEIDKAPRDFPNDLLQEIDEHSFFHPFDAEKKIQPKASRPPIVVATSNAERRLPDAFLRRCIVHHIELTPEFVRRVVHARADQFRELSDDVRNKALKRFFEILRIKSLTRQPATGEFLTWLAILAARGVDARALDVDLYSLPALQALIKDPRDRKELERG